MAQSLESIRREYTASSLDEEDILPNPNEQFQQWLDAAFRAQILEPTAMTLATTTKEAIPNARIVLLKGFDERGFVFFTNYESKKGTELAEIPRATLLFYWKELERQVRISGTVTQTTTEESEVYFSTRPRASQLAAWASRQSDTIANRLALVREYERVRERFSTGGVPVPPHWGGYRLLPTWFEFWQGRENRLHDRIAYKKTIEGWNVLRLAP
jgi:pyridoxamine 5'-phosphate oxidase